MKRYAFTGKPDFVLLGAAFFLIAFGLIMVSSAGAVVGFQRFGSSSFFFREQFVSFLIGLAALCITMTVDYRFWRRFAVPMLALSMLSLLLVLIPSIGFEAGGARRWMTFGNFQLQPSELTKLTFLIYLALWLEKRGEGVRNFTYGFLPFLIILGTIVGLVMLQPDLGTVTIIILLSIIVYFLAGARLRHIIGFFAGASGVLLFLIKISSYRSDRLTVFLNPEIDPQRIGYHINQALLAIGSGGLFGLGLGHSRQKYNFLPEVTSDSIFAVIAEEVGFFAVTFLVGVFILLLLRGIRIARAAPDAFGKYLAAGIAFMIVGQAFVNIAALTGLIPLTGVTLPFISYGGSSLVVTMAAVGLLANISRHAKQ